MTDYGLAASNTILVMIVIVGLAFGFAAILYVVRITLSLMGRPSRRDPQPVLNPPDRWTVFPGAAPHHEDVAPIPTDGAANALKRDFLRLAICAVLLGVTVATFILVKRILLPV